MSFAVVKKTVLVTGADRPGADPGAVQKVESLDILINNAGVSVPDDLSDRSAFERHLAVNLYGTLDVTQAFLPSLTPSYGADGVVYQTYSTTGRGVEFLMPYYGFLDRAPKGRDEDEGWQLWIRRHDEYDTQSQ